jgi:hypothetical protein
MRKYGLDAIAVARAVEELTDTRFGFSEDDFDALEVGPAKGDLGPEDL